MGLVSETPREVELPDLNLVGVMALVDFRTQQDPAVFLDTWQLFYPHADSLKAAQTTPNRSFGLNLFPMDFPEDMRWYYGACVEVVSLERDFPPCFLSRFLPAAKYHAFEVVGPVSEIGPAFQQSAAIVAGLSGGDQPISLNLELYDQRFTGPDDPESRMELLFTKHQSEM